MNEAEIQGGVRHKFLSLEVKSAAKEDPNILTFRGSTADVDRDGDVIHPEGVILDSYLKNPLFLWGHDWHGRLPIGKAVDVRVEKKGIDFDILFDAGDPFAMDVKRKYENGFLNAVSVGLIPKSIEDIREKETNRLTGFEIKEWELLELSGVPIPANPNALQLAYSKFLESIDEDALEKELTSGEETEDDELENDEITHDPLEKTTDEFVTTTFLANALKPLLAEIEELKSLISVGAPTVDEGGEFDDEESQLRKRLGDLGVTPEEALSLLSAPDKPSKDVSVASLLKTVENEVDRQLAYKAGKAWTLK